MDDVIVILPDDGSFMSTFQNIWLQVFSLFKYQIHFPEPIGYISALDMMMFWAVAYMLADSVSMVASRRD